MFLALARQFDAKLIAIFAIERSLDQCGLR
jgi:hypothetical protein